MSILSILLMSIMIMLLIPKTASFIMGTYKSFFSTIWRYIPKVLRFIGQFFEMLFKGFSKLFSFIKKETEEIYRNRHNQ